MPLLNGFIACLLYMLTAILLIFTNKMCFQYYSFSSPSLISLSQSIFSLGTLIIFSSDSLRIISLAPLSISSLRRLFPISILFLFYMILGMISLNMINIPMYTTLRRTGVVFVLFLEYYMMGITPTMGVMGSVILQVGGAIIAGYHDISMNITSFIFIILYNLSTAAYLIYINKVATEEKEREKRRMKEMNPMQIQGMEKGMVMTPRMGMGMEIDGKSMMNNSNNNNNGTDLYDSSPPSNSSNFDSSHSSLSLSFSSLSFSSFISLIRSLFILSPPPPPHSPLPILDKFDFMFYNNLTTIPFYLIAIIINDEWGKFVDNPHVFLHPSPMFYTLFFLSSILAFFLNYFIFLSAQLNSPLTQTVAGQTKDLIVVSMGLFFMVDGEYNLYNILGIGIGFIGSIWYGILKIRGRDEKKKSPNVNTNGEDEKDKPQDRDEGESSQLMLMIANWKSQWREYWKKKNGISSNSRKSSPLLPYKSLGNSANRVQSDRDIAHSRSLSPFSNPSMSLLSSPSSSVSPRSSLSSSSTSSHNRSLSTNLNHHPQNNNQSSNNDQNMNHHTVNINHHHYNNGTPK